jgi:hypothetical protein
MGKRKQTDVRSTKQGDKASGSSELVAQSLSPQQQKRQKNALTDAEFKSIMVRINVTLPPCYAGNPISGVKEQLNRFILR